MVTVSVCNGCVMYNRGDLYISVAAPRVIRLVKIVDFKNGLLTADAEYPHGVVEEYFDFYAGLCELGCKNMKKEYFSGVSKEDIIIDNTP